ncbi:MAG: DEAD/DEAH box helicase, partial [Verrucomicrobiota bacterium]|nr:DEAD/DEAH box helicase [Verrucomicrobiota bacterium]
MAEHEPPRQPPKPKGEIPAEFAESVFGQVHPMLQHAVAEEGYLTPTPIQEKAIPHLIEGRDLLGCAQTGTGKTAAFLLPILHRLTLNAKPPERNAPRALILAPTRELAAQIADSTATYGKFLGLPFAVVFGGVSQYPQVAALNRGAALVVATPGRLLDLMEQGHVSLDHIEEFVLDEADRMLDMGFMPDIKRILSRLPEERHTQFFSATLSPEVLRLAMSMVKDPVHVTISPDQPTVDKINQKILFVDKPDKAALLASLLNTRPEMAKVIVFARTRHGSDKIADKLEEAGIRADAIHSDKTQRARTNTLNSFRNGRIRVLIATDIASRGIDVDGITHVVNFDLPEETESYVHRIGRTARAGADGAALSFVSAEERGLLRAVERMIRKDIPVDT